MKLKHIISTLALLAAAGLSHAGDVVVIVNKANDNAVDKALIAKIYTGESKVWANGGTISAIDLTDDNPGRASFANDFVGKSPAALKSLWTQNVFTGKAVPPKSMSTDEDVKKAVAANKGAIGYIKAASADDTVKVVLK